MAQQLTEDQLVVGERSTIRLNLLMGVSGLALSAVAILLTVIVYMISSSRSDQREYQTATNNKIDAMNEQLSKVSNTGELANQKIDGIEKLVTLRLDDAKNDLRNSREDTLQELGKVGGDVKALEAEIRALDSRVRTLEGNPGGK